MDKKKSEKLKEILNQTLTTEDIEKKLKEEIKNTVVKKQKEKKKKAEKELLKEQEEKEKLKAKKIHEAIENLETQAEKDALHKNEFLKSEFHKNEDLKKEPLKEKVVIPSVREKKKEEQGVNTLLYLVGIIAILLLSIVVYLFTDKKETNYKKDIAPKEKVIEKKPEVTNSINEKIIIEKSEDAKEAKEKIIPKKTIEKKDEIVIEEKVEKENKKQELEKQEVKQEVVLEKPKEIIKIKEVIKEKIITKTVKLDKKNFKKYYNSTKFNSLKCYNFKAGDVFPNTKCKADLKKFLTKNKNALRFEIIPVIAEEDNKIFSKMESNLKSMDKAFQNKVKEYMFRGLSRERVLETSWYIKDQLGEDTILTPTNYYVKSKKNNKGLIIKAYH